MQRVQPAFYPEIQPYRIHRLEVDEYNLYLEESGNPDGLPVLFLHGGPGAGSSPYNRRFFNPAGYRIVIFDQRGCGKSTPHAALINNTTSHLVADIERIREYLRIDRWIIFGGSWGSTLALAYAEAYSQRVLGLILRGIFLCRDRDLNWFYQEGASALYPDAWQDFIKPVPPERRHEMMVAYHELLTGDDELIRMQAAKAWANWEGLTAALVANREIINHFSDPYVALSLARIECHYFINHCFMRPNQLIENAARLKGIPGTIVHGRYDVICPLEQAWELHNAWPDSRLLIIDQAGHAATEPGIAAALLDATDVMLERFK
ncbi:MAG TPA: prolyl aminopeptidase [Gammaproteobacteria bacterium]|nr:prolyl aminopeptidase [Gammaproteobacteria bacterium]